MRGEVTCLWDLYLIWTMFGTIWRTNFSFLSAFLQHAVWNIHWQQVYCFLLHLQCTSARTVCLHWALGRPRHTFLTHLAMLSCNKHTDHGLASLTAQNIRLHPVSRTVTVTCCITMNKRTSHWHTSPHFDSFLYKCLPYHTRSTVSLFYLVTIVCYIRRLAQICNDNTINNKKRYLSDTVTKLGR